MSKILVQGNPVQTQRAVFTEDDKQSLSMYESLKGFQVHSIKISKIFIEFTDSTDTETFDIPEKVGEEYYWPESETFCKNQNKRKILLRGTRCKP